MCVNGIFLSADAVHRLFSLLFRGFRHGLGEKVRSGRWLAGRLVNLSMA